METPWDIWKKAFNVWENQTATYMEEVLQNPALLRPSGKALGSAMRAKANFNDAMANLWGTMGLPTKRDQERMMHAVNQLQSKLYDLEERLDEIEEGMEREDKDQRAA